jgi:hypothetical protein
MLKVSGAYSFNCSIKVQEIIIQQSSLHVASAAMNIQYIDK